MPKKSSIPIPGQRWVSRAEPELGLGIIVEVDDRSVLIHFAAVEATRRYSGADAPLRRVYYIPGDLITDQQGQGFVVEEVDEKDGLLVYRGGGRELIEVSLSDASRFNDPSERLMNGQTDSTAVFNLRQKVLLQQTYINESPIRGFVGGRIDLMPHQLFVAQEVANRHAPRVLLADEPGLGKTIEACLILHRLVLNGRVQRALIVVPNQLIPQWIVELKRRFNLLFSIYDEARCAAIEDADPETNPFCDSQLILCGLELLSNHGNRLQQAVDAGWDIVIVDEAHRLRWNPENPSPQYGAIEELARRSPGLLLITATPEQLGKAGHFARLRLLDPHRYHNLESFLKEPQQHFKVARLADSLLRYPVLDETDIQELQKLLVHETEALKKDLPILCRSVEDGIGDRSVGARWATYLLDLYGPGRVMFRNTREAIQGFPKRQPLIIPLGCDDPLVIESINSELMSDLKLRKRKGEVDYQSDPRIDWLLEWLQKNPKEKALLICTTKTKCQAIERALRIRAQIHAGVFHEDLTTVQRDRNAAWFADSKGTQLLICSEIGSEGRNFQFVRNLVLFDLPLDPDLLEQRIGRLERIGQKSDIQIHIPFILGTAQEVLVRWHCEGIDAIRHSTSAGASFLERFEIQIRNLVALASKGSLKPELLKTLIRESMAYRIEVVDCMERDRDRMIELTSFRPRTVETLVDSILAIESSDKLEACFIKLMEHFAVYSERFTERSYRLNPDALRVDAFPDLETGEMRITFDRATALARWDLEFISIDHPLLQRAFDTLLLSDEGNSAFALWEENEYKGMLLEATFLVETLAPAELHIERYLSTVPLRIVVDHKQADHSDCDRFSSEVLEQGLIDADPEWLLENQKAIQRVVPRMLRRTRALAKEQLPHRIREAQAAVENHLLPELDRLRRLVKVNDHIRPEEIEMAEKHLDSIRSYLQSPRIRLQALRLIWRGPIRNRRPMLQ